MSRPLDGRRVLVTGGAGFIGSELVGQLHASGARVEIVDDLSNGRRENVAPWLGDGVGLRVADVRDEVAMRAAMTGIDVVYHLACLGVRHSIHAPLENHEVNATATLRLLELARELGVGRFVYVSSSEVYGTAREAPIGESHPTLPHTVYGGSKLAGECYARAFWDTYRYPTVVVRPFNSYGPRSHHEGDSGEVIPKFMLRALAGRPMIVFGDGTQTRDFTYVADTARGILELGLAERALGRTVNLGQGEEISIRQLADAVAAVVAEAGGPADARVEHVAPRPGDVGRLIADTTLARELVGFRSTCSLPDGLRRLRDWYAARGERPEELLANETVRNWEPPPSRERR